MGGNLVMKLKFLRNLTPYVAGDIVTISKESKAQGYMDAGYAEEVVEQEAEDTNSADDNTSDDTADGTSGGDGNVSPARKGKGVSKTADK